MAPLVRRIVPTTSVETSDAKTSKRISQNHAGRSLARRAVIALVLLMVGIRCAIAAVKVLSLFLTVFTIRFEDAHVEIGG